MKKQSTTILACLLALATPAVAPAQTAADELPPALLACKEEADVLRRLSCYDREIAALEATPAPEPAAEVTVPAAPEPVPEPDESPPPAIPAAPDPSTAVPAAAAPAITGAARAAPPAAASSIDEDRSEPSAPTAPSPAEVTGAAIAAPPAEPLAAAAPAAVDSSPEAMPASDPSEEAEPAVTASVVDIRTRPYGEMIILLDNDQVWEQKHVDRRFRLAIGDVVTIRKGAIGGYRMSGSTNYSVQVERIR